ncbi:MAG: CrcB family protein [Prevotellaceae bacterium]|nr:CrcB family protein [Prevotellaceae bacterium]
MLRPNLGLTLLLPGAADGRFPWSTFAANALGCLLIGLLRGEGAAIGMAPATKETGGGLRVERSPPRRVRRR